MRRSIGLAALFVAAALIWVACGNTQPSCEFTALSVTPSSGTADRAVSAPGNQVQFVAAPVTKGQCAAGACANCWGQTWTVSDAVNVSISNENLDNGTATCLGKTNGAVTVTATAPVEPGSRQTVTGTAKLSCQ